MTPQEAMKLVEECGLNIEGLANIECESVVFSALEKQIPKKPVCRTDVHTNTPTGFCPVCSLLVHENITERHGNTNYCRFCGQALDWRDTK